VCARVDNQRSRGIVTARVQTDAVRSFRHQYQDLHQSTYPVPLERSELILLPGRLGGKERRVVSASVRVDRISN
jgi:hypothetical protein